MRRLVGWVVALTAAVSIGLAANSQAGQDVGELGSETSAATLAPQQDPIWN